MERPFKLGTDRADVRDVEEVPEWVDVVSSSRGFMGTSQCGDRTKDDIIDDGCRQCEDLLITDAQGSFF